MSVVPQAIHSNLSRPHPTDSRLLQNLIKGEKAYIDNLASSSVAAHAAASALAAWGTSEAPDIAKASQTLAEILSSVADAERTQVQALDGYRGALKDVLDREHSIRSVVRDRDILVGRLIKASKKKVSKKDHGGFDEKNEKVMAAQRELHACEQVLASEEAALVGVKRRTFKEALTMRMKTLGDAGAAMVDAAKEAILLLDEFDTHGPLLQASGGGQYESMYADEGVEDGTYDDHGAEPSYQENGQAPQAQEAYTTGLVPDGHGGFHKDVQDLRELDPRFSQQFEAASVTPSQSASQVVHNERNNIPLGERYSSQFEGVAEQDGTPSDTDSEEDYRRAFIEPRRNFPAPHAFGIASETQDSFIPQSAPVAAKPNVPKSKKSGQAERQQPPSLPAKDTSYTVPMPAVPSAPRLDMAQARDLGPVPTAPRAQFRANDDDSSDDEGPHRRVSSSWGPRPGRVSYQGSGRAQVNGSDDGINYSVKRESSIFDKVGKLFKTDLGAAPARERSSWDSRTDRRIQTQESQRKSMIRRNDPDSSDDEPDSRTLVRHVNNPQPLWERDTTSDVGMKGKFLKTPSVSKITPGPLSNRAQQQEEQERLAIIRASVVGNGIAGPVAKPQVADDTASVRTTGTKSSKKKKAQRSAGSEVGTAPTRTASAAIPPVPTQLNIVQGDASSGVRRADAGPTGAAPPSLSRSSTMQSASGGKKKKRASVVPASGSTDAGHSSPLQAFSVYEGKYSTASWVGKPASQMTAAEAVANAGLVPKASPSRPQSVSQNPALDIPQPSSRPASIKSSASKSGPLKPALKAASLSPVVGNASSFSPKKTATSAAPVQSSLRNETTASLISSTTRPQPLPQPQMAPIPTAPAPVTSAPLAVAPQEPAAQKPVVAKASTKQPQPSARVDGKKDVSAVQAPKAVPSLGKDDTIDGTGHLDVPVDKPAVAAEDPTPNVAASRPEISMVKTPMPRLDVPDSEPFKIDLDNLSSPEVERRGSALTDTSEPLLTPSAEATYHALVRGDMADSPSPQPVVEQPVVAQPGNVTRVTDRKVSLQPSRIYGVGGPDLSDSSSDEGSAATDQPEDDSNGTQAAQRAADIQASATLADPEHQSDPTLDGLSAAAPAIPSAATTPQPTSVPKDSSGLLTASPSVDPTDVSDVTRRKSVRLAPDTKLPPDTPIDESATPKGNEYGGQDPIAVRAGGGTGTALSSRIAPPPAAPAKLSTKPDGPSDLAGGRERSSWTSRIPDRAEDSSSDEDDDYSTARKAFGSASKSWGEATGKVKPKTKPANSAASVRSKTSTSSKKVVKKPTAASATAPASGDGATVKSSASVLSAPAPAPPSLFSVSAPAPLSLPSSAVGEVPKAPEPITVSGSYLTAADLPSSTNEAKPTMPPVPQAPAPQNQGTVVVPAAPPPAIESTSRTKSFFGKLKKFK